LSGFMFSFLCVVHLTYMKLRFLLALLIFALPAYIVFAGTAKQITLKDGSVIKGELVSFANGIYTLQTDNLGRLQLPEANVVSVASEGAIPQVFQAQAVPHQTQGGSGNAGFSGQVSAMQSQMMSNPQTMQTIQAMVQDPEISAMMADPNFIKDLTTAVSSNDPQSLANNPNIQKLMSNPRMQSLIQQFHGGTTASQE